MTTQDDYTKLFDLKVADQYKEMLPRNTLQFIFQKKGTEKLSANEIADLADLYDNGLGRIMQDKPFVKNDHNLSNTSYKSNASQSKEIGNDQFQQLTNTTSNCPKRERKMEPRNGDLDRCQICRSTRHNDKFHKGQPPRRCYICLDTRHITSACPKRAIKENWTVNHCTIDTDSTDVSVEVI